MNGRRWPVALLLAGLVTLTVAAPEAAEGPSLGEYQVKAAFIYNFAKFVEWPREASFGREPFVVTVIGDDPFGGVLDQTLRGKTVGDRAVVVRRAFRVQDIGRSQVLFISDSERERLPSILKSIDSSPILTVGQMAEFAARGGIIGFRLDGDRVRLDISLNAAERSKLKISSQLLRVARVVHGSGGD